LDRERKEECLGRKIFYISQIPLTLRSNKDEQENKYFPVSFKLSVKEIRIYLQETFQHIIPCV
jgi:hypothetical protein